ncbi:hypothetical protein [Shinella fusca]|uniref:Uncharacterized protein n=1 Tax=Shinella fusca TaxID=544480 RepID=A0A7W7YZN2_9HYPH|nr:hypothetical protein [Shinella fusca]MBB5045256.1 hypothetical protein [Shinella fusca]
MTLYETSALSIGTALTLVAIVSQSLSAYLAGHVIAGTGNGLGNLVLRCPASHRPAVSPEEHGKLIVLFFMLSYLAFGLTAVLAGMAVGAYIDGPRLRRTDDALLDSRRIFTKVQNAGLSLKGVPPLKYWSNHCAAGRFA